MVISPGSGYFCYESSHKGVNPGAGNANCPWIRQEELPLSLNTKAKEAWALRCEKAWGNFVEEKGRPKNLGPQAM